MVTGRAGTLLSWPSTKALRGWWDLARLSYPACVMKCSESWAFNLCTCAAAWLPNPQVAVAAIGVSYNVYGMLFITYVSFSMAACVQVSAAAVLVGAGGSQQRYQVPCCTCTPMTRLPGAGGGRGRLMREGGC